MTTLRRIPSNRMPADAQAPHVLARIVIAWLCVVVVAACVAKPALLLGVVAIFGFYAADYASELRRNRRFAADRAGESICTFARGFDRRATDTWTLRAVHAAIGEFVAFPIRADDRFADELKLDDETVEDIAEVVARRTGRPLEGADANPTYGKVRTVRDLVTFFAHQPRRKGLRFV